MKSSSEHWKNLASNVLPPSYEKWFREEKKYIQKSIKRNSLVLEVGCGDGRSITNILNITKNIVGIDHDQKAVDRATKNFSSSPRVKILLASAENMPFNDKTFDAVLCIGTFSNFAEKKLIILNEVSRVLKDDGIIIVSTYSENALDERLRAYKALNLKVKEIQGTTCTFEKSVGDNVSEQFTKEELRNIFSRVNLKVKNITKVDIGYLCKLAKRKPKKPSKNTV